MKFKINFEHRNGEEDYFVVEGDSIEEIRVKSVEELDARQGKNAWSENIDE